MNNLEIVSSEFAPHLSQFGELATICTELWNTACGDELAISGRVFTWLHTTNVHRRVLLARQQALAVGFLLASQDTATSQITIEGIAVHPRLQRQGIGERLIETLQNEAQIAVHLPQSIYIDAGQGSLLPGVPSSSDSRAFFAHCGFTEYGQVLQHNFINVATYQPPVSLTELPAGVYAAQIGQKKDILDFLANYPPLNGKSLTNFVQAGRRLSDLMLLWTEEGIQGICQLGFEDSLLPIELSFPYRLARPWAQIGNTLLAPNFDDTYHALLIDASLRRFHNTGINSAVFTSPISDNLCQQFALEPIHSFQPMGKQIFA